MTLVNVTEDVKPQARAPCRGTEFLVTDILARPGPVEHEMRRAVGDQDIDVRRSRQPLPKLEPATSGRIEIADQFIRLLPYSITTLQVWLPGALLEWRCHGSPPQ